MSILLILMFPILLYLIGELLYACKRIRLLLEMLGFNMQPTGSGQGHRAQPMRASAADRPQAPRLDALHERRSIDWSREDLAHPPTTDDRQFPA